jgi:uncharacterized RDD family membrane protein YckC
MTITDQRLAVDPALIARGRELVEHGRMPSKRELQKHLGKSWDTVNAVLSALADEAKQEATAARLRARRGEAKKRRAGQRRRRINVCFSGVNGPVQAPVRVATPEPVVEPIPEAAEKHPASTAPAKVRTWPILIIAAGAFVAVWAGWVGLGGLTGFGLVNLLPGLVADGGWATIDTRITLPASMEAYSAYAFYVLLHRNVPRQARLFAAWSAGLAVALGMGAQVAYHQMIANGVTVAPPWVISVVSCIPVATFALGAALRAMVRAGDDR